MTTTIRIPVELYALGPSATEADVAEYCEWADAWFAREYSELDVEHVADHGSTPSEAYDAEQECFAEWCAAPSVLCANGWSADVTTSDRAVVWGEGTACCAVRVKETRISETDSSSDEGRWLAHHPDGWVVWLSPAEVATSDLDGDRAVAGYRVVETGR